MIIHDANKKIQGFVAHKRVQYITRKLHRVNNCQEHLVKLLQQYPIRCNADMYSFSSIDHSWMDNMCQISKIDNIIGYNLLNIPFNLSEKYAFMDEDLREPLQKSTFIKCSESPVAIIRALKIMKESQQNCVSLIPISNRKVYKSFMERYITSCNVHILSRIPKGTMDMIASDHWYDNPTRKFKNPYDMLLIASENDGCSIDTNYRSCVEDILNTVVKGKKTLKVCTPKRKKKTRCKNSIHKEQLDYPTIYTDASVRNSIPAVGIWSDDMNIQQFLRLTGDNDVNRAELMAILIALLSVRPGNITILSDSMTALDLIKRKMFCDKYQPIVDCIHHIVSIRKGETIFLKVKGHSGVVGNENADFLARYGVANAERVFVGPDNLNHNDSDVNILVQNILHVNCIKVEFT